ncbi:GNAT family N-acetyltransferase [Geodermatophilus marinus]|uniref:GNAT family N-acetyltransferase n=1 Tax=Geodermatophilus sp. LHW52908 TaxID=2303986 RepID=UPI000E3D4EA4|nr:GNAT family N-acetyltransferase [Geodermatophilus sp. LHW52908]RFU22380.1 GNAT family N-acetyltransferase [Geodermatophilus sp. LHW52908]
MSTHVHPPVTPVGPRRGAVRVTSPAPREVWAEVLASDPLALPTQTPAWTDWLCGTRGFTDRSRLYEFDDGRRLVLPLVARTRAGLVLSEESMPYGFGYGGPLVAGCPVTGSEAEAVLADLAGRRVLRSTLTPNPLTAGVWAATAPPGTVRVPFLCHVLDLAGGFPAVWSTRFRPDVRRKVRRAERQPLDVRLSTGARLVETFTALNRRTVDRWAEQRGRPPWIERLVERRRDRAGQLASALPALGAAVTGWTAHLDGEPVAAYVVLRAGEQAYFWMSAMDRELAGQTQAGALLQSLAIEEACRGGARWFHLGESDPGSGVARFKAGFGAAAIRYEALRFERLPLTAADERMRAVAARATGNRPV